MLKYGVLGFLFHAFDPFRNRLKTVSLITRLSSNPDLYHSGSEFSPNAMVFSVACNSTLSILAISILLLVFVVHSISISYHSSPGPQISKRKYLEAF